MDVPYKLDLQILLELSPAPLRYPGQELLPFRSTDLRKVKETEDIAGDN